MDIYHPVNVEGSCCILNLVLDMDQVFMADHVVRLHFKHGIEALLSYFCATLGISEVKLISHWKVLLNLLLECFKDLLALFLHILSRNNSYWTHNTVWNLWGFWGGLLSNDLCLILFHWYCMHLKDVMVVERCLAIWRFDGGLVVAHFRLESTDTLRLLLLIDLDRKLGLVSRHFRDCNFIRNTLCIYL